MPLYVWDGDPATGQWREASEFYARDNSVWQQRRHGYVFDAAAGRWRRFTNTTHVINIPDGSVDVVVTHGTYTNIADVMQNGDTLVINVPSGAVVRASDVTTEALFIFWNRLVYHTYNPNLINVVLNVDGDIAGLPGAGAPGSMESANGSFNDRPPGGDGGTALNAASPITLNGSGRIAGGGGGGGGGGSGVIFIPGDTLPTHPPGGGGGGGGGLERGALGALGGFQIRQGNVRTDFPRAGAGQNGSVIIGGQGGDMGAYDPTSPGRGGFGGRGGDAGQAGQDGEAGLSALDETRIPGGLGGAAGVAVEGWSNVANQASTTVAVMGRTQG